jgi:5-amino-6-(5-phosphoribosylamino)uracil reductase
MTPRPFVIVKCAVSLDGFIDDDTPNRLMLSSFEDFQRVDEVRASCDAILVGAGTIRADDPRLELRSELLRSARTASGRSSDPVKVTMTTSGALPRGARFFQGSAQKLVYLASTGTDIPRFPGDTETVARAAWTTEDVLADLHGRGISRLLVEGGAGIISSLLVGQSFDEFHLSVAPLMVGRGVSLFSGGKRPERLVLVESEVLGDTVLLRYRPR